MTLLKLKEILNSKITLYILLGLLTFALFKQCNRTGSLEDSLEIYEADNEALRKRNLELIDSFALVKKQRAEAIETREKEINDLLAEIESLLNTPEDEEAIDTIRDPGHLSDLFAKYYPDHARAGQGSD